MDYSLVFSYCLSYASTLVLEVECRSAFTAQYTNCPRHMSWSRETDCGQAAASLALAGTVCPSRLFSALKPCNTWWYYITFCSGAQVGSPIETHYFIAHLFHLSTWREAKLSLITCFAFSLSLENENKAKSAIGRASITQLKEAQSRETSCGLDVGHICV